MKADLELIFLSFMPYCTTKLVMRRTSLFLLSVLLLSGVSEKLFSQNFLVRNYNVKDGIESANVNSICQDENGNLWFGTSKGVSFYNSNQWTNFSTISGLPAPGYTLVHFDQKKRLWAFPENPDLPVSYFENKTWMQISSPVRQYKGRIEYTDVKSLTNNSGYTFLAVGTTKGLYRQNGAEWEIYLKDTVVYSLARNGEELYIATEKGLFRQNLSGMLTRIIVPDKSPVYGVHFIKNPESGRSELYYFTSERFAKIVDGKVKTLSANFQIVVDPGQVKFYITSKSQNNIFFGNQFKRYWYSAVNGNITVLNTKTGFNSNGATAAFTDREGIIWFASSRGIDKIIDFHILRYSANNELLEDEITAICEPEPGTFVYGHNFGLSILRGGSIIQVPFGNEIISTIAYSRVLDISRGNPGKVCFTASKAGVGELDYNSGTVKWLMKPTGESFNSTIVDQAGVNYILSNHYLYKADGGIVKPLFTTVKELGITRKLFTFAGDRGIYIAGSEGVVKVLNGVTTSFMDFNTPAHLNTYALLKLGEGHFLLGTSDGLMEFQHNTFLPYQLNGKSLNEPVYCLSKDSVGRLWIGTNDGIIIQDKNGKVVRITTAEGLASSEINRGALLFDSFGNMRVGSDKGLTVFTKDFMPVEPIVPKIVFMTVETNEGVKHNLTGKINVGAKVNVLTFSFYAVSFINEDSLVYAVKLVGYDKEWRIISQKEINRLTYKKLDSGTYEFLVRARNYNGKWSGIQRSGIITIDTPYYYTWWFALLLIAGVFSGGYSGYKYRNRNQMLMTMEKIVAERTRKLIESQNELQSINEKLEERVEERTFEVERANRMLLEEIRIKEEITRKLEESRENLSKAQAMANLGSWQFDFATGLITRSDQVIKIFNKEISTPTISITDFIKRFLQESDAGKIYEWFRMVKSGIPLEPIVIKVNLSGGIIKYLHVEGVPKVDQETGSLLGVVGVVQDVTERRLTALELEKINRELKLSNANKDKFFSIISHDLRSPFQSLLGFTNLLDEQFDEIDRSESKIFIENIKSTTIRLYQMLEDLLSWSRIQMGSYNPKITGLNLHTVTADVIYLMKPNAERKHIEIGNKITDTLMVLGDESMLKSIMQNLISNAVKFTPNGGTVFIEASVEDDFVSVVISDSGVGMDAEKVSTLFELDKVISSEGTDGEKGSGLGLILTNEMVVKQGGQITVNSEPGKGTKICFTLLKYSGI